ncbi:hypothetical protein [Myxococcus sp. SDU36]|uniref:hypothetical protein n=1 Tax=Myxococcus sp. SDU36 TaxID=2831967 RepID=UPI0025435BC2|nr:hypothetical protein [Myxococcus sp. SDU36]WIG95357.1 hypothetical protein KGD87_33485 [Myxococcus sp. SDU36]
MSGALSAVVLLCLLPLGATAAEPQAATPAPPPSTPTKPPPPGEPPRARVTLSEEDQEVVEHLELLESLDAAEDLDLLLELGRED